MAVRRDGYRQYGGERERGGRIRISHKPFHSHFRNAQSDRYDAHLALFPVGFESLRTILHPITHTHTHLGDAKVPDLHELDVMSPGTDCSCEKHILRLQIAVENSS
jgi:hypothetical protein